MEATETAPSAGVETVDAPVSSPSPSEAAAPLTQDEIIDRAMEESEREARAETSPTDESEPAEAKADDAAKPEVKEPAKEDDEPDEQFVESEIPESWKETLKKIGVLDQAMGKQIRKEHYQLAQYTELMPLEQVRAISTLFTDHEEARRASLAAGDMQALNYSLTREPERFFGFLQTQTPESFGNVVKAFPEWLRQNDPEAFRSEFAAPAVNRFLAWAENTGKETGNELAVEAASVLADMLKGFHDKSKPGPEEPYKRELQVRQQQDVQRKAYEVNNFISSVEQVATQQMRGEITKALDRLGSIGLSKEAKDDILNHVSDAVAQAVLSDPSVPNFVRFEADSGRRDQQQFQQIVQKVMAKARPHIGAQLKQRVSWVTKNYLGNHKVNLDKSREVASQREVGAGAPAGAQVKKIVWDQLSDREKKGYGENDLIDRAMAGEL